jgi:hypothetical protein
LIARASARAGARRRTLVRLARASPASFTSASIRRRAPRSPRGSPSLLEPESDIAGDAQVRKQRIALEHHVDRPPMRRHRRDVDAIEQDFSTVGRFKPAAAAVARSCRSRRPEQREELAS